MDNFATDMLAVVGRSSIEGKPTDFSYMIKVLPKGEMRNQMVKKV